MKYILSIAFAFLLVLPSSGYSQKSGTGSANPPAKAKATQPAQANNNAAAVISQPKNGKNNQPAVFTKINGDCLVRAKAGPEAGKWIRVAKPGQKITSGDDILVRTGDVEIELYSGTTIQLKAESMVTYFKARENIRPLAFIRPEYPTTKIKVTKGKIFARVSPFEISKHFVVFDTPSGVAGIRGTTFDLTVGEDGQLTVRTSEGQVVVADPSGNFTVDIGSGVQAILKKNEDGSFSIKSPEGQAVAYSPNTTFKISPGGALNLDLTPDGKTSATVPEGAGGSVNVQVGNIQTNLSGGQGVNLEAEAGGTTIESTGSGTVFTTVDGKNVVSLDAGDKILVTRGEEGTVIQGQSGTPAVTGPDGQPKNLESGEKITVDNNNQVNIEGEPCTPSASPYKPCN